MKGNSHWLTLRNSKTVKFNRRDLAEWLLLIADLLKSGFSLRHAVEFSSTIFKHNQVILEQINDAMKGGTSFADCLQPYVKPNLYYQLLLAEQHGNLEECLQELGKVMGLQEKQRQKLSTLLQYPLILLGLLGCLTIALKLFVFPELSQWNTGEEKFTSYFWWIIYYGCGVCLLGLIFSLVRWYRMDSLARINWLCRLPVIGKCWQLYYGYYVTINLAMMIRHGLTIKEICSIVELKKTKSFLSSLGILVKNEINQGRNLTKLFHQVRFLPQELKVLTEKGSTLTNLGDDLTALANILFTRLTKRLERLLMLVQPIVFGIIALAIVALYLQLLLPIYHSMQEVM